MAFNARMTPVASRDDVASIETAVLHDAMIRLAAIPFPETSATMTASDPSSIVSLDYGSGASPTALVTGDFNGWKEDVSELARRMGLSGYFADVKLLPAKKSHSNEAGMELVQFQLEAKARY